MSSSLTPIQASRLAGGRRGSQSSSAAPAGLSGNLTLLDFGVAVGEVAVHRQVADLEQRIVAERKPARVSQVSGLPRSPATVDNRDERLPTRTVNPSATWFSS